MRFSLSKVKIYPAMSDETVAHNAVLMVDGVAAADTSNRGHGDPNLVQWRDPDLRARCLSLIDVQPPVVLTFDGAGLDGPISTTIKLDDEYLVSDLLARHQLMAWLKRQCKRHVLYRTKTMGEGEWLVLKNTVWNEQCKQYLQNQEGDNLLQVGNELILQPVEICLEEPSGN